jgi:hypothetical protein
MKTDTARTMTTALADISTPTRKPEKKGDDVTDGISEGRGYSSCHRRVLDATIIGMSFTSCFRSRKASRENKRPAVAAYASGINKKTPFMATASSTPPIRRVMAP